MRLLSGALLDIPAEQIGEFEKELFAFVDSVLSATFRSPSAPPASWRTMTKEKLTKAMSESAQSQVPVAEH